MKNKLTEAEKIILENTPKEYKYIARDKDGELYLYQDKPQKGLTYYSWCGIKYYEHFYIFNHLFKNIKWEDEEPYKFR